MNSISFHCVGFVIPLAISGLYACKIRRHARAVDAAFWLAATFLAWSVTRVDEGRVVVGKGYALVVLGYAVANCFREPERFMPAGAVGALFFFNIAIPDVAAAWLCVPAHGSPIVVGGWGLEDGLVVYPFLAAFVYWLWCGVLTFVAWDLPSFPDRDPPRQSGARFLNHHFCPRWSKAGAGDGSESPK